MYHSIVKRIARKNFLRVNQKDFDGLLKDCAPNIHHRFGGDHALGGERHDRDALREWFGRLGRLGATLKITVHDVWVKGMPWNTTIIVRWSATQDMPDKSPYLNRGVHIVRMAWGKIVDIDANEDSQIVADSLKVMAAYGVAEAVAAPIVS
ncbi:MAG: nuclear transport factor 2 family protein [Steroidobacteraceae bacterium]